MSNSLLIPIIFIISKDQYITDICICYKRRITFSLGSKYFYKEGDVGTFAYILQSPFKLFMIDH